MELSSVNASGENRELFAEYEDSIRILADNVLQGENDSIRIACNKRLVQVFENVLKIEGSFFYPFDSIKPVSLLTPSDNAFRLFTWTLPKYDRSSYTYLGFIQVYDKKRKITVTYALNDISGSITKPETERFSSNKWYGAFYYNVLLNKKHGKRIYTLLGWKGKNNLTTQKVIDVIYFSGKRVMFGRPVFKVHNKTRLRIVFEYNAQAVMSLAYNEGMKMIVFDHLSPSEPSHTGKYEFYGPDFSYDGFRFKKGKWMLVEDIVPRNTKEYDRKVPKNRSRELPIYKSE